MDKNLSAQIPLLHFPKPAPVPVDEEVKVRLDRYSLSAHSVCPLSA